MTVQETFHHFVAKRRAKHPPPSAIPTGWRLQPFSISDAANKGTPEKACQQKRNKKDNIVDLSESALSGSILMLPGKNQSHVQP